MPREQNGVLVYGQDERDIPAEISGVSFSGVEFLYGIRQVELDGRKTWVAATKEDKLAAERRRTGKTPDGSGLDDSCRLTGPASCGGQWQGAFCVRGYDPVAKIYYCFCTKYP